MTIKSKTLYIFSSLALLLAGCTDDFLKPDNISANQIVFNGTVDGGKWSGATRSGSDAPRSIYDGKIQVESQDLGQIFVHSIINEDYGMSNGLQTRADDSDFGNFYVTAYATNSGETFAYPDGTDGSQAAPNFMVKDPVNQNGIPERNRYWPNDDMNIRFFAFYSNGENDVENHSLLHYDHSVSSDVDNQNDVMVAVSGPVSSAEYRKEAKPVPLQFHHILTKVKVKLAEDDKNIYKDYKIASIGFNKIVCSGTFYLKEFKDIDFEKYDWNVYKDKRKEFQENMWVRTNEKTNVEYKLTQTSADAVTSDGTETSGIDDLSEKPMMMIPQSLDDVELKLTLVSPDNEQTEVTVKLDGKEWTMGDEVEYVLSSSGEYNEEIFEIYWFNGKQYVKVSDENHEWGVNDKDGNINYIWHAPFYDINYYDNSEVDMTDQFQIVSYRRTVKKDGEGKEKVIETPLGWDMSGAPDNDAKTTFGSGNGDWLIEKGPNSFDGSSKDKDFTLKVRNQQLNKIDPRASLYQTKSPADFLPADALDSDGYWDLSMKYRDSEGNVVMNTSNCYIINAPGKYKFPAIYGNAISHGMINDYAFQDERTSDHILKNFYISGSSISDKYQDVTISSLEVPGTDPKLIWTDSRDMNVTIDQIQTNVEKTFKHINRQDEQKLTFGYIRFTVTDIVQGNFCIGFENMTQGTVWSWHLWVTPYSSDESKIDYGSLGADKQNEIQKAINVNTNNGDIYELFPYNLGWCDRLNIHYGDGNYEDERPRVYINTYVQEETGKKINLIISQKQANDVQYGNNLLFQWGRRTPFRGAYIFQTASPIYKKFYEPDNTNVTGYKEYLINPLAVNYSISHILSAPKFVYLGDGILNWCDTRYDNLWSVERTINIKDKDGNVKPDIRYYKTIYDPSPVGYMVPPTDVFDKVASSGTWSESPIWGAQVEIDSKYAYFPVNGYRNIEGILSGEGEESYYHTSTINPTSGYVDGIHMIIDRSNGDNTKIDIKRLKSISRIFCGAIRPIREPGYDYLNVDKFVQDPDITVDMQ